MIGGLLEMSFSNFSDDGVLSLLLSSKASALRESTVEVVYHQVIAVKTRDR